MKASIAFAVCLLFCVITEIANADHIESFGCRGTRSFTSYYRTRCGGGWFWNRRRYCLRSYTRLQYTLRQQDCPSTCGGCGGSNVIQQIACWGMTISRRCRGRFCYGYICCSGYTKISFNQCRRITEVPDPDTNTTTTLTCGTNKYGANTLFRETDEVVINGDINSDGVRDAYPRIINGQNALQGQFPWQVRLSIRFNSGTGLCGGSIVANTWILTAAHCVSGSIPSQSFVYVGDHQRSVLESSEVRHLIQRVVLHPSYNTATNAVTNHDLALIQLTTTITYNENVSPVCLPSSARTYTGRSVIISGWGTINQAGQTADILQFTRATVVDDSRCDPGRRYINEICAVGQGPTGSTACNGDSGGPMTIVESGRAYLIGVTWFGNQNCPTTNPFAYTDVGPNLWWINSVIT